MRSSWLRILILAAIAHACRSGAEPGAAESGGGRATPDSPTAPALAPSAEPDPVEPAARLEPAPPAADDAPTSGSAPEPRAGPAADRGERVAALIAEHGAASNAQFRAYQDAFPGGERPSLEALAAFQAANPRPDVAEYAARILAIVEEDPRDPAALAAARWIAIHAATPDSLRSALTKLEAHHLDRPELGELCDVLGARGESAFLARVLELSPHVEVRGRACFALAGATKQNVENARRLASAPEEQLEGWRSFLGADRFAQLRSLDVEGAERAAEALFERAAREFGDVVLDASPRRRATIAERAARELHELRHLAVGRVAPEIEGEDLDGVAFKLSDYRGKVVLLDFWGNW